MFGGPRLAAAGGPGPSTIAPVSAPSPVMVRDARPEDADAVAAIIADGLAAKYRPALGDAAARAIAALVRHDLEAGSGSRHLVAELDGRIAGAVHLVTGGGAQKGVASTLVRAVRHPTLRTRVAATPACEPPPVTRWTAPAMRPSSSATRWREPVPASRSWRTSAAIARAAASPRAGRYLAASPSAMIAATASASSGRASRTSTREGAPTGRW